MGIKTTYVALDGDHGPSNLEAALNAKPNAKMVMLESPTNPMHRVCDIRALSRVCRARGVLLEVTWAGQCICNQCD